jgi:hypothetical protein
MASLWAMPRRAAKCLLTSRLRGGLWYDPQEDKDEEEREEEDEEDGDESYYTTTEDDDGAYDQAGGVLSQMGSQTFELPDGRRVTAGDELPVRLGDDMTLEQAESDTRIAPPGTFAGGCDLFLAEALLPRMRSSWVDGKVPREETTPLHLYDVYGLEEYVRLAGEEDEIRGYPFDPSAPDANHPRNLLKVPLEPTPQHHTPGAQRSKPKTDNHITTSNPETPTPNPETPTPNPETPTPDKECRFPQASSTYRKPQPRRLQPDTRNPSGPSRRPT